MCQWNTGDRCCGVSNSKAGKASCPRGLTLPQRPQAAPEARPAGRGHKRLGTKDKWGYRTNWKLLEKLH